MEYREELLPQISLRKRPIVFSGDISSVCSSHRKAVRTASAARRDMAIRNVSHAQHRNYPAVPTDALIAERGGGIWPVPAAGDDAAHAAVMMTDSKGREPFELRQLLSNE